MTEPQRELALALARVTFYPGSSMKRFAADMAARAANPGGTQRLTPRQHAYLIDLALKFRRQLPCSVVLMAEQMKGEQQ